MTEEELNALSEKIAGSFVDVYAAYRERVPKALVLVGMTGALAACATEAGMDRDKVIAALGSAFDDIEGTSDDEQA